MAFKSAIGKVAGMGDDFVSAHDQTVPNTPGEPLSDTEPKSETKALPSSNNNFSPVLEESSASDKIQVPVQQRHECESNTPDVDISDSDWKSIDEDTPEEAVDDERTSHRATKDHEVSGGASENENASNSKHSEPTWDGNDNLVSVVSSNMGLDSAISVQAIQDMGKMYQKQGKFGMAEPFLRRALHELDRIAGGLHEYTLGTIFSLAAVLSHQGRLDEAGKLARRAVRGYLKVKGPRNAATMNGLREISCAYSALCCQLLQHDPPADSKERHQVSRHTDRYISICQELPLSEVSAMLGGLGTVLAWAGYTSSANLAFQWKYASPLSRPRHWHVCNMCGQEILSLPLHVCLTCMDVELCPPCYRSFALSNLSNVEGDSGDSSALDCLSHCMTHEFFKVETDGAGQLSASDELETAAAFHAWLQDAAKKIQGPNTGLLSDTLLIGAEETPTEALSSYLIRRLTTETSRAFMKIQVSTDNEPFEGDTSETGNQFQAWFQDAINSIPSSEPFFGVKSSSAQTVPASVMRHAIAMAFQDEYLWNSFEKLWKYNPNYPPNQQEMPSIAKFAGMLMDGARSAKEAIPKQTSSLATSRMIPSYSIYDSLPLSEGGTLIRLLELLPGDATESLVCRLVVEDILASPVYEAVSYTWGIDANTTHETEVQVNSVELQVTPNLHACLLALRHRDASRVLWVDAICINQKNDQEKSEQVARMASIYNSASNVLVYLGDGGEAEEALFRYFNRERKEEESFEDSLDRLGLVKLDIVKTFASLCRREWWTRIWIQQEFALPPTDPTFCLGHLRAQATPLIFYVFKTLCEEAITFEMVTAGGRSILTSKREQHIDQAVATLNMRPWFQDGPQNLKTIFSLSPQSKCCDPRDFIFGRYVFMNPILRAVFKPDYSLTTESLFEMVAIWLLKVEIGMELFRFYPSRLSSKSPSWVPDFTKRVPEINSLFQMEKDGKWRAEGQENDPLDIEYGLLKVYGRPLDTISNVFRVGNTSLPEFIGQIMFLERSLFVIAEEDTPQRRHPLSEVLPDLKAKLCPEERSLGINDLIYELFPRKQVSSAITDAANFVYSQFLESCERFLPVLCGLRDEEQLSELTDICSKLAISFGDFNILFHDKHLTKLFWASLCDLSNLIGQIKDLRIQSRPPSPPSRARQSATDLMNQMIKEIRVSDVTSPATAENDNTVGIPSSSSPNYEELQAAITDCEFEGEVQLRARYIVHLAKLIKSSVDVDGEWIGLSGHLQEQVPDRQEGQVPKTEGGVKRKSHDQLRQPARGFPHRTIFITEQRLVGIGKKGVTDIRAGDELIMLENMLFPMMIRPRDLGFYEIVGYADIHGLDGQAFHNLGQELKPPRRVFKVK